MPPERLFQADEAAAWQARRMSAPNPPPGYVQIDVWTPDRLSAKDWVALAIAFVILAYVSILNMSLAQLVFAGVDRFTVSQGTFIPGLVMGAAIGVALHELGHAAAFLAYGGRPRFGFKLRTKFGPVFWAGAPGCYMSKAKFAAAALAPTALLTALLPPALLLAPVGSLAHVAAMVAYVLGVSGSAGDVVILGKVMRYPSGSLFEDGGDGFKVFETAGREETQ